MSRKLMPLSQDFLKIIKPLPKKNVLFRNGGKFYIDKSSPIYPVLIPEGDDYFNPSELIYCNQIDVSNGSMDLTLYECTVPSETSHSYESHTFAYLDELERWLKSIKDTKIQSSENCFVVTATFGTPYEPEVIRFRNFRDQYLLKSVLGKQFIRIYYNYLGPETAKFIRKSKTFKNISAHLLNIISKFLPEDC